MATAVVAVGGTVLTVDGVVRGSQVASAPQVSTAVAGPSNTDAAAVAPAGASKWPLRGALGSHQQLLQQVSKRAVAEAPTYPGSGVTGRPLFLGDTAAGRVAVVLVSSTAGIDPWVLVLGGESGAPIADLHIVGNVGELESTSVTRLIQTNGRWFLFTLTDPSLTTMQVSWHPVYGSSGVGVRSWAPVDLHSGVSVTAAPGQAVAAKVRMGRAPGRPVLTAPVVQDSKELNDPSFFPVTVSALTPLRTALDVTAGQAERVTWTANQLATVTGFAVAEMNVAVLWSAGQGASAAEVLASFRLPGGGTLVAYAGPLMSGYSAPQVAILPVKDRSVGFAVTAWKMHSCTPRTGQTL